MDEFGDRGRPNDTFWGRERRRKIDPNRSFVRWKRGKRNWKREGLRPSGSGSGLPRLGLDLRSVRVQQIERQGRARCRCRGKAIVMMSPPFTVPVPPRSVHFTPTDAGVAPATVIVTLALLAPMFATVPVLVPMPKFTL